MRELPERIPCPVAEFAEANPDRHALVSPSRTLTYWELNKLVDVVRSRLEEKGIKRGSPVATCLVDDWKTSVILWALVRMGACMVPLNLRQPPSILRDQLAHSRSQTAIIDDRSLALHDRPVDWSELDSGETLSLGPATVDLSTTATVIFTSGSTGSGKAVAHELRSHWFSALGSQTGIPVGPDTRWLVVLPLYHVGGLSILFRCFLHGGCVLLSEGRSTLASITSFRPTHVSLVATQLHRLLEVDGGRALATLDCVLVGGSHTPETLVRRATGAGIQLRKTYGLTEMASQVTATSAHAGSGELATSGRVLPHRELRVSGDGEIEVRGPTRFGGYLGEEGLVTPFDADGWFATGDVGHLDESGLLKVAGRLDTMFVSGGENVHPEEIEEAILNTGLTDSAVVVPVEDEEFGARPVAFVSPVPDEQLLRARLRERMAGFKLPVRILALPEESRLKPDRAALKDLASR